MTESESGTYGIGSFRGREQQWSGDDAAGSRAWITDKLSPDQEFSSQTQGGHTVTQALSLLPDSGTSLAILAGAGISLDSPSNLLAGRDFMDAVLSRIMPKEIDSDTAQSLISVPSDRHFRPGEYIRFETLMGELVQSRIDPDLHVLDCLDECEHPNFNHYVLAELVRRGSVVMTTNFDRLIEVAYQRTAKPGELPLRVVYNDAQFPSDGPSHSKEPVLWKLHGSLSVD